MSAARVDYRFPTEKLLPPEKLQNGQIPCIIATCGSYNPITTAHVQMFTSAYDSFEKEIAGTNNFVFAGAFLSPVNDAYKKPGLAPFEHRAAICDLVLQDHPWLATDRWEGLQSEYVRSYMVLSHIRDECMKLYNRPVEVFFLCGGDLFETFYKPGCWELVLLEKIFKDFYLLVAPRTGSANPLELVKARTEPITSEKWPDVSVNLSKYADKVKVIAAPDSDGTEISSTLVRQKIKEGKGVDGLILPSVVEYCQANKLYQE